MKENREYPMEGLNELCEKVRVLVRSYQINEIRVLVCEAMDEYPDSAQPHNLYGIMMEEMGDHAAAMRHFRAAYALDPSFVPARKNLETYGGFSTRQEPAFTAADCVEEKKVERYKIQYDENGVGRVVRRGVHDFF